MQRITSVLLLALLVQTLAVSAPLPCAEAGPAPVMVAATDDPHAAHRGHHGEADPDAAASNTADESMDCCNHPSAAHCAAGGCLVGGGIFLAPRPVTIQVTVLSRRLPPAMEWLPPYGTADPAIFRPPIA